MEVYHLIKLRSKSDKVLNKFEGKFNKAGKEVVIGDKLDKEPNSPNSAT